MLRASLAIRLLVALALAAPVAACDVFEGRQNVTEYADDSTITNTIRARLKTFHGQTAPLVEYYQKAGLLNEVQGEGPLPEVNQRTLAAARYLGTPTAEDGERAQQEINRFVRWFGPNRSFEEMKAPDVERYGGQVNQVSGDPARALEPVRAFLAYAKKAGLSKTNLGTHLRAKKAGSSRPQGEKLNADTVPMSAEGYARLQEELKTLEDKRPQVVAEITRAAADKDFRENAPLQAAKEEQSHLEGRIQELQAVLKVARVVSDDTGEKIGVGCKVVLCDLTSGDEVCMTLVHAAEANLSKGKMSAVSPTGKAVLGRKLGDTVEVVAPVGKLCYKIVAVNGSQESAPAK